MLALLLRSDGRGAPNADILLKKRVLENLPGKIQGLPYSFKSA
jgi:hypothetical protein